MSAIAADVCPRTPRLLIVPGLHDSGPAHWQSWLERGDRAATRVVQRDFAHPDLARWSARIDRVLETAGEEGGRWIAVAHSFGTLALVDHLRRRPDSPIREALLVAPADPDRFGIAEALPHRPLGRPLRLIASRNDPWMSAANAARWAARWGASLSDLGAVGHINTEAGFGPFPLARQWVEAARARAARERRVALAEWREWSFAI
ncbi:RBBP9/YdeN family alpha/beta hydrolase [Roseateles violae]|uniref:Alpha/beta hydrolase n=1 Tax=Roseateles violae TaxID=3058042 RepID=A0ABT8DL49_9BURK|nr:alpha/beta hydrolase [Pelomonas sp. PFR6]MDN3918696.1 alpha/beta hydrolase [Pelomonas sp. PFR6]